MADDFQNKLIGVIVDAYSSGSLLAPAFAAQGRELLHVQSCAEIPPLAGASFKPKDFLANIIFAGSLDALLKELKTFPISFVIAGCESGVLLADLIRDRLQLHANDQTLSRARRNKFEMIEAVGNSGLLTAKQFKATTRQDILDWAKAQNNWPLVVKPLESAGTDGVFICHAMEQVGKACDSILGVINQLGITNDEALIQTFLAGEEYIVNTVSWQGKHVLSDVRHVHKKAIPGAGRIYDYIHFIDPDLPKTRQLAEYIFNVLDALAIDYGPAHSEVIMTPQGPALIETGARMDGVNCFKNKPDRKCLDAHQLQLTVEAYLQPQSFLQRVGKSYRLIDHSMEIALMAEQGGTIKSLPELERLRSLASFWDMHLKIAAGSKLNKTVDLITCPGHIWLMHKDPDVVRKDYETIRELEREGFYDIG